MTLDQYISAINQRYKLGNSTEHTFRGDLQQLIETLAPRVQATNEPQRQSCGAPDYILTRREIPIGFIEAKDIGDKDLDGLKKAGNKEQFDRYKASLGNLIFTDYLDFHLYRDGQLVTKVRVGEIIAGTIKPLPLHFPSFENLIKDFCTHKSQTITSSKKLAEMMAGKARLLSDVIEKALTSDEENQENSTLKDQMNAFKQILIHDITPKGFADVYAQTIAYGMFAARLHDPTLPTFSRHEAAELIPKSNPFLRKLFGYIAGPDIDDRIKWIVDSLIEIFLACNVQSILKNYGKTTKTEDPIIHFYETFLSEYDPELRKKRGVWYTPAPVVNFIVRAVDDILKKEFALPSGLADTSKTKIKVNLQETDRRYRDNIKTVEEEVHKVQILDPAAGTGTFLADVVKHIHRRFEGQKGAWGSYVDNHLLPRLNGFELLMASYAMAHLQLDLLLTGTGYQSTKDDRFRIFLTNSLEESHPDTGTLFANWLSQEANEANRIKRDTPVMCVIGNPPYSGESSNKGAWIMNLMADYKKEPGGKEKLKEKNSKWINADENKFIRYGQHFIQKNGTGVLAYINPHGFLDNPTLRGMRWNLLKTFDKIYVVDLHGNSNKEEEVPNGIIDQNVFNIMQGVSINIFIKTGRKHPNELGEVSYCDVYGSREHKYQFLQAGSIANLPFKVLKTTATQFYFKPKNLQYKTKYEKGFSVAELFLVNGNGIVTKRDSLCIQNSSGACLDSVRDILSLPKADFYKKYNLPKDVRDWRYEWAYDDVEKSKVDQNLVQQINYRPFDTKYIFYTGRSRGFVGWPVSKIMGNYVNRDNIGLLCPKSLTDTSFAHVFVTNLISEAIFLSSKTGSNAMNFPLYLYPTNIQKMEFIGEEKRIPNFNLDLVRNIAEEIGLKFTNEKLSSPDSFAPVDIFDYIYAVLHSPSYREKYKIFLKIDFPRIPYPKDQSTFWQMVELGGELRQIHLLESSAVEKYITQYPVNGSNLVTKSKYENGKVYINDTQYFDGVPELAWNFYIGGYQPAQKWLKDRKDRHLQFDDILHYQKIIVALTETHRIMHSIDKIAIY